jgi:hypothetical protein
MQLRVGEPDERSVTLEHEHLHRVAAIVRGREAGYRSR